MLWTSTFCRDQEQLQRDRADAAILSNVRKIATTAAIAWGEAAALAERIERSVVHRARLPPPGSFSEEVEDRLLSENVDGGGTSI